jgi:hypothetical protein
MQKRAAPNTIDANNAKYLYLYRVCEIGAAYMHSYASALRPYMIETMHGSYCVITSAS